MHASTEAHPEPANFTPPKTPEEALARIKEIYRAKRLESEVIMVAAQTKALEMLMACMMPVSSTGDTRLDNFYARERNRQRLAAIQTLLHIRTVQREERLRRSMRVKAKQKTEHIAEGATGGAMVGAKGEGHADNGIHVAPPAPSPPVGEVGRESGRENGRPESPKPPNAAAPPAVEPTPPMLPADARLRELRRLRAAKMARRRAEARTNDRSAPDTPNETKSKN